MAEREYTITLTEKEITLLMLAHVGFMQMCMAKADELDEEEGRMLVEQAAIGLKVAEQMTEQTKHRGNGHGEG
jgi:hypothetical protein